MRSLVRSLVEFALTPLPRATKGGDRLILAYHNVVASPRDICGDRSLHLAAIDFKRQLDIVRREADIVPLSDLLNSRDRSSRLVAITFDDGYASSLEHGVRVCALENLPCTIFVASALADVVPHWDTRASAGRWSTADRETFLLAQHGRAAHEPAGTSTGLQGARIASISEWQAVSKLRGVTIGNHSTTHPNLGALTAEEAIEELVVNQRWLERTFGDRVVIPVAAYPYGRAPEQAERVIAASGLRAGMMVEGGWIGSSQSLDRSRVPRWNVPSGISLKGFTLRLRGRLI